MLGPLVIGKSVSDIACDGFVATVVIVFGGSVADSPRSFVHDIGWPGLEICSRRLCAR